MDVGSCARSAPVSARTDGCLVRACVRLDRYIGIAAIFSLALAATGAMAIACGVAAYALSPSETTWSLDLLVGFGILIPSAVAATKQAYALRRPKTVTLDSDDVLVFWLMPRSIPWQRIGAILVRWELGNKNLPETHWIEFYPVQDDAQPNPLLTFEHRERFSAVLRRTTPMFLIRPRIDLGSSPTVVLDALDRFRPSTVPIHDALRIVSD